MFLPERLSHTFCNTKAFLLLISNYLRLLTLSLIRAGIMVLFGTGAEYKLPPPLSPKTRKCLSFFSNHISRFSLPLNIWTATVAFLRGECDGEKNLELSVLKKPKIYFTNKIETTSER